MVHCTSTIDVKIPVGGETVTMVCRRPTAAEMSEFLRSRFETKGRKVKSKVYEARQEFMDKILIDMKNVTFENAEGAQLPLNAQTVLTEADKTKWSGILGIRVESWRDLVSLSWKSSAAMRFEDPAADDEEEDAGN